MALVQVTWDARHGRLPPRRAAPRTAASGWCLLVWGHGLACRNKSAHRHALTTSPHHAPSPLPLAPHSRHCRRFVALRPRRLRPWTAGERQRSVAVHAAPRRSHSVKHGGRSRGQAGLVSNGISGLGLLRARTRRQRDQQRRPRVWDRHGGGSGGSDPHRVARCCRAWPCAPLSTGRFRPDESTIPFHAVAVAAGARRPRTGRSTGTGSASVQLCFAASAIVDRDRAAHVFKATRRRHHSAPDGAASTSSSRQHRPRRALARARTGAACLSSIAEAVASNDCIAQVDFVASTCFHRP